MPPQPPAATETFPRPRRIDLASELDEPTRLDVQRLTDVADPTVATRVRVSPIGTHTVGAAWTPPPPTERERWQAAGRPPRWPQTEVIDALLDDRDRLAADTRAASTGRRLRVDRRRVRTVREEAAKRAAAKLRHERHLEILEAVRAWLYTLIAFGLLVIVVGAGAVGWGILDGWFTWQLVRTR